MVSETCLLPETGEGHIGQVFYPIMLIIEVWGLCALCHPGSDSNNNHLMDAYICPVSHM